MPIQNSNTKLDKNYHLLRFDTTGTSELTLLHTIKEHD